MTEESLPEAQQERIRALGFDKFRRPKIPRQTDVLLVTLSSTRSRGEAALLNQAAYDALDQPEAVELHFSVDEQIIGFSAAPRSSADSFAIINRKSGTGRWVRLKPFVQYFGITIPDSRVYAAELRDGMLRVGLKTSQ